MVLTEYVSVIDSTVLVNGRPVSSSQTEEPPSSETVFFWGLAILDSPIPNGT